MYECKSPRSRVLLRRKPRGGQWPDGRFESHPQPEEPHDLAFAEALPKARTIASRPDTLHLGSGSMRAATGVRKGRGGGGQTFEDHGGGSAR